MLLAGVLLGFFFDPEEEGGSDPREISVTFQRTTQRFIPENITPYDIDNLIN
jgi:hypothetical protein